MIPLAIVLGFMGMCAMRRARRCHAYDHGFSGGGSWCGEHHGHHGPRGHGGFRARRQRWMLHAFLRRIDAMPAQERVIAAELDKLESRVHDAKHHFADARGDLGAALRQPELDDAALGAVLGHVDAASSEVRSAGLDAIRAIHAVLDEKQREAVATMLDRQGRGAWFRGGPYR